MYTMQFLAEGAYHTQERPDGVLIHAHHRLIDRTLPYMNRVPEPDEHGFVIDVLTTTLEDCDPNRNDFHHHTRHRRADLGTAMGEMARMIRAQLHTLRH